MNYFRDPVFCLADSQISSVRRVPPADNAPVYYGLTASRTRSIQISLGECWRWGERGVCPCPVCSWIITLPLARFFAVCNRDTRELIAHYLQLPSTCDLYILQNCTDAKLQPRKPEPAIFLLDCTLHRSDFSLPSVAQGLWRRKFR